MNKLFAFIFGAVVFEIIALMAFSGEIPVWVSSSIVGLVVLYGLFVALRSMKKQIGTDFPPSQIAKVVRKRHWHM